MHAKTHIINVKDYHDKTTENVPTVINYNKVVPSYIPYLQRNMEIINSVYTLLMDSFISFIKKKKKTKILQLNYMMSYLDLINAKYQSQRYLKMNMLQKNSFNSIQYITDLRSQQQPNMVKTMKIDEMLKLKMI
jgi:hypothetical protein